MCEWFWSYAIDMGTLNLSFSIQFQIVLLLIVYIVSLQSIFCFPLYVFCLPEYNLHLHCVILFCLYNLKIPVKLGMLSKQFSLFCIWSYHQCAIFPHRRTNTMASRYLWCYTTSCTGSTRARALEFIGMMARPTKQVFKGVKHSRLCAFSQEIKQFWLWSNKIGSDQKSQFQISRDHRCEVALSKHLR